MQFAAGSGSSRWLRDAAVLAFAAAAAFSLYSFRKRSRSLKSRIRELEGLLESAYQKIAAERQGRIRAQQATRKSLEQCNSSGLNPTSYPMSPIAIVRSCFSTRNGTPRQPSIVPLARACLVLDPGQVPIQAIEGLSEYSHCWILYVFHLNTDLEKLWKEPSRSKFKAKVRVPRLKGDKIGALATRSPHRPCPIGLTVAKVEAVLDSLILLSGVDLVDGTPVLDIKPYLPYSDCIHGAKVPEWVTAENSLSVASVQFSPDFYSTLSICWVAIEQSMYSGPDEFQSLIEQVLSWDIRSVSQRNRPHGTLLESEVETQSKDTLFSARNDSGHVSYHLILEGIDISYRIDDNSVVIVEKATLSNNIKGIAKCCNYSMWRDKLEDKIC